MQVENGKKYYVSDISVDDALRYESARTAIGTDSKCKHMFENSEDSGVGVWKYAVPVPEKTLVPYTLETVPKMGYMIRPTGTNIKRTPLVFDLIGVALCVDSRISTYMYSELLNSYEMIFEDGRVEPFGTYNS